MGAPLQKQPILSAAAGEGGALMIASGNLEELKHEALVAHDAEGLVVAAQNDPANPTTFCKAAPAEDDLVLECNRDEDERAEEEHKGKPVSYRPLTLPKIDPV